MGSATRTLDSGNAMSSRGGAGSQTTTMIGPARRIEEAKALVRLANEQYEVAPEVALVALHLIFDIHMIYSKG